MFWHINHYFYIWVHIFCLVLYSKDVRLPIQLQRAMAAEAEAAREARAKVKYVHMMVCQTTQFIKDIELNDINF